MASLVLGTAGSIVGGMIGGPVGASIGYLAGSLVGSLIDPPKVEGPKLSDLKLQHSTYGSMIPVLYGTKRVSGNVIWQTDLIEHKQKSSGKGGPQITSYTYTASWAVALCEGPIAGIRKLWADGRLIIADGNPTNDIQFVLYTGTEDQLPDPTIEAEEGAGEVPAHRGMAYIVFTDVQLGDYGNRIFQLEAEVYTATGPIPSRVNIEDPPPPSPSGPIPGAPAHVRGATLYAGMVSIGRYRSNGATSDWLVDRYDLESGEFVDTTIEQFATYNFADGIYHGATNDSGIAFFVNNGMGSTGNVSCWVKDGRTIGGPVNNPAGTHTALSVKSPPVISPDHNYLYATGDDTGAPYIAVWTMVDREPLNTAVASYSFTGATASTGQNIAVAVDESGNAWAAHDSTMGATWANTLTKFDFELNLLYTIPAVDLPPEWSPGYPFVVWSGYLAFQGISATTFESAAIVYSISGTTFTYVGEIPCNVGSFLDLGNGLIQTSDGVISLKPPPESVVLGDIVADISERCGLAGGTGAQYDVSDLPETVYGYVIAGQMTGKNAVDPLRALYLFDGAEVDDHVLFKHRTHDAVADIDDDELGVHDLGSQAPPLLEQTRTPESELPRTVNLIYLNTDTDYQAATQYARRETSESELDTSLNIPIVLQDAEARERVNGILYSAWVERTAVSFSLSRKWAALVPTDVVTIQGYRIRLTQVQQTVSGIVRCAGLITRAFVFDQDSIIGAPGGGFIPQDPTSALKAATELVLLDIPLQSSGDATYGFYAAMAPQGAGAWPGASLFKSLDGGVNYVEVASTPYPATIGTATTALGDFGGGSPSAGAPVGGGALALWETRVIPGGVPETVYTMQVVEDCDVTVACSSGGVPVWVAHGEDSTDWIAYGAGVAYPPLWVLAGEWFSWKFGGTSNQDMRPQAKAHTAIGVGAGGGTPGAPGFDDTGTVDITLHDASHSLESINDAGLANGMNKAALRSGDLWEIFQFQTATLVAPGQYQLSNLLRGVDGTGDYIAGHEVGDDFVLLSSVINVDAPQSELNRPYLYKAVTSGSTLASASAVEFTNTGAGAGDVVDDIPPFIGDGSDASPPHSSVPGLVPAAQPGDCADGKFLSACGTWEVPGGGGGGGTEKYLTVGAEPGLPNSREIVTVSPIAGADGGAGGAYTFYHTVSGVTAATYGSATQVPVLAVDANGHITSVTNTTISSSAATILSWMQGGSTYPPQSHFGSRKVRQATWSSGTGAPQQFGLNATAPFTGGGQSVATGSLRASMTGGLMTSTAVAGTGTNVAFNQPGYWRGNAAGLGGFFLQVMFAIVTPQSGMRYIYGVGTGGTTGNVTATNPSAKTNILIFGVDAADSNLQVMHNDGTGTATKIDLGANFPGKTADAVYRGAFYCEPNDTTVYYRVDRLDSAFTATGTLTTDLPANTSLMDVHTGMSNGTTAAIGSMLFSQAYSEALT